MYPITPNAFWFVGKDRAKSMVGFCLALSSPVLTTKLCLHFALEELSSPYNLFAGDKALYETVSPLLDIMGKVFCS